MWLPTRHTRTAFLPRVPIPLHAASQTLRGTWQGVLQDGNMFRLRRQAAALRQTQPDKEGGDTMAASPAPIGFNDEGKLLLFGIEAVSFCVCLCRLCVFERGSVLVCVCVCARGHARERGGG